MVASLTLYWLETQPELRLLDPDGYMRLVRIEALVDNRAWTDSLIPRSNAPYGETLHWSRPMDLLLLAATAPLLPFVEWRQALFLAGVWFSPVVLWISLFGLVAAYRRYFRRGQDRFALIALTLFQAPVVSACMMGRPDHHSLLLLIFLGAWAFVLRFPYQARTAPLWCGLCLGLGMWVSVETLAGSGLVMLLAGWLWLAGRRHALLLNLRFNLALLATCLAAVVIDPPQAQAGVSAPYWGRGEIAYDRLSIVHLFIFSLITLFWAMVAMLPRLGRWPVRLSLAAAGGVMTVGLTALVFPVFYSGPYVEMPGAVAHLWLERVSEVQPLLGRGGFDWGEILLWTGTALVALAWCASRVIRSPRRWRWFDLAHALALGFFLLLAFYQVRWSAYAALVAVAPYTFLFAAAAARACRGLGQRARRTVRLAVLAGFCLVFQGFHIGWQLLNPAPEWDDLDHLPRQALYVWLNENLPEESVILTGLGAGPEILYHTDHRVVATPYHRNVGGIWDSYRIMTAPADVVAERRIRQRGIDYLLLLGTVDERVFYQGADGLPTTLNRLETGGDLEWLEPLDLPGQVPSEFRLFRVDGTLVPQRD